MCFGGVGLGLLGLALCGCWVSLAASWFMQGWGDLYRKALVYAGL